MNNTEEIKPMSFEEFQATVRALNKGIGIEEYEALAIYIGNLPENIEYHPGDIVKVNGFGWINGDIPELTDIGVVVEGPKSMKECYDEYKRLFKRWVKVGKSAKSFYEESDSCNDFSDGLDYVVQTRAFSDDEEDDCPCVYSSVVELQPAPDSFSEANRAVVLSWYEQYLRKADDERKEVERLVGLMMNGEKNPRYIPFKGPDDKWGIKNVAGDIVEKPIYKVVEREDGVVFFDGEAVCRFHPDEGLDLLAWGQPWWEDTMCGAHFPEDLNHYWWNRRDKPLDMFDEIWIENAKELDGLTPLQIRIIDDLLFTCRYNEAMHLDGDEEEKLEKQWFAAHPNDLSNNERTFALAELVRLPDLPEQMKESLWFANFMFIEYFCFLAPDKKQNEIDWK